MEVDVNGAYPNQPASASRCHTLMIGAEHRDLGTTYPPVAAACDGSGRLNGTSIAATPTAASTNATTSNLRTGGA